MLPLGTACEFVKCYERQLCPTCLFHGKQFIATLPIYKIDFDNPGEAAKHQRIVELVQTLMRLKEQLSIAPNIAQRTVLERSITAVNADLNCAIDELYQVESQDNEE